MLIQTQTVSGVTAVNFTTGITSTYRNYLLVYDSATNSNASSYTEIYVQLSTNGGSSYITSGYYNSFTSYNGLLVGYWSSSSASCSGTINLMGLTNGSAYISASGAAISFDPTSPISSNVSPAGSYATASTTVNAFRVIASDSSSFSGTFSLHGIEK